MLLLFFLNQIHTLLSFSIYKQTKLMFNGIEIEEKKKKEKQLNVKNFINCLKSFFFHILKLYL